MRRFAVLLFFFIAAECHAASGGMIENQIFWAGESCCITPDEKPEYSLFGRLRNNPPPGFVIMPDRDLRGLPPGGYGGLTAKNWLDDCGECSWSDPGKSWSKYYCFQFYKTGIVVINLGINDLFSLHGLYAGDIDEYIKTLMSLMLKLKEQGHTVIFCTEYPLKKSIGGAFGRGRIHCDTERECKRSFNSNYEYLIVELKKYCADNKIGFIDFFNFVRALHGDALSDAFLDGSADGIHPTVKSAQVFYQYVMQQLPLTLKSLKK